MTASLDAMSGLGRIRARSSLYRTKPVGGPPDQRDYLNAVVALEPTPSQLEPRALLADLHRIEASLGRRRRVRWEARVLDLDLLAMGATVVDDPDLVLPHPRMLARPFVLIPLLEVAPDWIDPRTGRRASEVLAELDLGGVRRVDGGWSAR